MYLFATRRRKKLKEILKSKPLQVAGEWISFGEEGEPTEGIRSCGRTGQAPRFFFQRSPCFEMSIDG